MKNFDFLKISGKNRKNRKFSFSKIFELFFWIDRKKYFLKKLKKKSGHQYRSKISLRIEWEHSQPLKTTLKHSLRRFPKKGNFLAQYVLPSLHMALNPTSGTPVFLFYNKYSFYFHNNDSVTKAAARLCIPASAYRKSEAP